jgi:aminoglycoside phosphotransferase
MYSKKRIAELEKDKARLDWLEKTRTGVCGRIQKYRDKPDMDWLGWQVGHRDALPTLREAIDAAMAEKH